MTSIRAIVDREIVAEPAKIIAKNLNEFGSKCSSMIEFGVRGGISALILFAALLDGKSNWRPRYVGVDLVHDDSIVKLEKLAADNNISFQFWKGHSTQYPLHESDGFVWDIFHAGGSLLFDLERISPYIHKYIFILGVAQFGDISEAVKNNVDIEKVAGELRIDKEGAKMGLKEGLQKFLAKNSEWYIVREVGELCVLGRKIPYSNGLFK